MVAGLTRADRPGLAGFRTRDGGDLSMALLDGWAAIADVVSFYTERIAQEGYLRTATERSSLVDLAALVGYRPRPGLGATTHLAYTVAPGTTVTVPAGTRAQSVPEPGALPATFETAEPLLARTDANLLPVRRRRPPYLTADTFAARETLDLAGAQPQVRPGAMLDVRFAGATARALVEVTSAQVQGDRTVLGIRTRYADGVGDAQPPFGRVLTSRVRGKDGTRLGLLVDALRVPPSVPPPTARALERDPRALLAAGSDGVLRLLGVAVPAVRAALARALAGSLSVDPDPAALSHWTVRTGLFGHQAPLLPRYRSGAVVGFTDPLVTPLPVADHGEVELAADGEALEPPDFPARRVLLLDGAQDQIRPGGALALVNDRLAPPVAYRTVRDVRQVSASALGITGQATRVEIDADWPEDDGDHGPSLATVLRGTTVLAAPADLAAAEESIDAEDVGGDELELDGLYPDLEPGRFVVVAGERTDAALRVVQGRGARAAVRGPGRPDPEGPATGVPGAELAMIAAVDHHPALLPADPPDEGGDAGAAGGEGGQGAPRPLPGDANHTYLRLAAPLAYTYRRATVRVHGNVVRASQGESVQEVLGSGDATRAWLALPLKRPPLTHLPAATAAGARSTLEVFVDGVRWAEVPDLGDAGPAERCYQVVHAADGAVRVVFGDGVHGLRPPTGSENIVARYRTGQGRSGNTAAGTVTTATSRPLGVTEVTNPVPATGGADPEADADLRERTPVSVRALDRLVSVQDYADLALGFAGIGSATASELTDGRRRVVHVTVAGIDDEPIDASSDLVAGLRGALLELGDPDLEVVVAVRRLRLLVVAAGVRVAADRRWEDLEPAVRAALLARFGPTAQRILRSVPASAVLATMAAVPGVASVDLGLFGAVDEAALVAEDPTAGLGRARVVRAHPARSDRSAAGGVVPAELVLLSPDAPDTLVLEERR
ncbi:putative baseplate assembly protein [Nocardioides sp. GY 10113]|uniref:putative baseplate assembly protein n=1 Tax=Nocardioides sp. GY 10113 TaxID=2569761 RepID=UPI00198202AB|nr:putative baseplate assembly protein [Nocardioides sp. GY 10113]